MTGFMSSLFGNAQTQPTQTTQSPQQTTEPAAAADTTPSVSTQAPAFPGMPITDTAPAASPLDDFADLWDTPTIDPAATTGVNFNLDPAKLMQLAQSIDFSKQVITPELMATINAGGEGATTALVQAMNTMSQNVFAQNATATTKLIEAAVTKAQQDMGSLIDARIKATGAQNNLLKTNPALKHPAMAPVVGALQATIQKKYPTASSEDIATMTNTYLTKALAAVNPTVASIEEIETQDWSQFLP